jgi:hypothetical protein
MEDIIGNMAFFTPAERELTGFFDARPIDEIDLSMQYQRIWARREYVQERLAELDGDYDQYVARTQELEQLQWDEATLMDIDFDITAQKSVIADALFDRELPRPKQ